MANHYFEPWAVPESTTYKTKTCTLYTIHEYDMVAEDKQETKLLHYNLQSLLRAPAEQIPRDQDKVNMSTLL